MKILTKTLSIIMAALAIAAFTRGITNAGPISIIDITQEIKNFQIEENVIEHISETIEKMNAPKMGVAVWDTSKNVLENIGTIVTSFITSLVTFIDIAVVSIINVVIETIRVPIRAIILIATILGLP